jgi:hypothetical protein
VSEDIEYQGELTFDKNKLEELRIAYKQAILSNKLLFIFEGFEVTTDYAKYLIEYLNKRLYK